MNAAIASFVDEFANHIFLGPVRDGGALEVMSRNALGMLDLRHELVVLLLVVAGRWT